MFLENYLRYTFVRYGVPYVVAIECFDGGSRYRRISCRDADKVAVRFLKALRSSAASAAAEQPPRRSRRRPIHIGRDAAAASSVFTYHSPGSLLPGTGFKGQSGVADYTVYSQDPLSRSPTRRPSPTRSRS